MHNGFQKKYESATIFNIDNNNNNNNNNNSFLSSKSAYLSVWVLFLVLVCHVIPCLSCVPTMCPQLFLVFVY